jgi:hypothetical protein
MPPMHLRPPPPAPDPLYYYQTPAHEPVQPSKIIPDRPPARQGHYVNRGQLPEPPRSNRNELRNHTAPQQQPQQIRTQNHRPQASDPKIIPHQDNVPPDNLRHDKPSTRLKPNAAPPLQPSNTPRDNFKPPQQHLPKKLVMPAPLQDQQQPPQRQQQQLRTSSSTKLQNRTTSDRQAAAPKAHVAFAQDIPMASTVAGKLVRKGSKLTSPPASEEPKAPPRDWLPADGDKLKDKEKARRRLSKKRTDEKH